MGVEIGLWNVDGDPYRLPPVALAEEKRLEEILESDPTLFGTDLLVIGRQVQTSHGGFIDLLAIDVDGNLHVLELKRDRTPREIVAQLLDYGSWVRGLGYEEVTEIHNSRLPEVPFEAAFAEHFKVETVPEELNSSHTLTIVAASLDAATERIVEYLREAFDVPINAMFFRYYEDAGHKYVARSWLLSEAPQVAAQAKGGSRRTRETWNGNDWYVSFGEESGRRSWDDARKYGFISAGGGTWYSRTVQALSAGDRVFVHIPSQGYVAVGEVTGEAQPFELADLVVSGALTPMRELMLAGTYTHEDKTGEDTREFVVPVRFLAAVPGSDAFWTPGLFANQNSACRLRNQFTIEKVSAHFGVDDPEPFGE